MAQQYTVTDLGTLGGDGGLYGTQATAINGMGQVVGRSSTDDRPDNPSHPFIWANGEMRDLGLLPDAIYCIALAINDGGQVVGYCYHIEQRAGVLRAFLWTADEGMTELPIRGVERPTGINTEGHIVGYFRASDFALHAFLYRDGTVEDLGPGGAFAINDHNVAAGFRTPNSDRETPRMWDDTGPHDLEDNGCFCGAYAINAAGLIAGYSTRGPTPGFFGRHAVLWTPYGVSDLGTLDGSSEGAESFATAINGDLVVGWATRTWRGQTYAYLYDINGPGYAIDLNQLIPFDSGWLLEVARGVNAKGQIVGWGRVNGLRRAFLLTPVSPPPR
jgi:probable HAF family extracellular repeat protein